MTNTVVTRRNFDQPVLYTLPDNGDRLFVLENVGVGLTTPGVAINGQGRDQLVSIAGTVVGAQGTDAVALNGIGGSVRVSENGRIAAQDFGAPPGGHSIDFTRGGEVVNFGRIDAGIEINAGREGARIVNTGTIGADGADGEGISVLRNSTNPAAGLEVEIVNTGVIQGSTSISFEGLTSITNTGAMSGSTVVVGRLGGDSALEVRNREGAEMGLNATAGSIDVVNQGTLRMSFLTGDSVRFVNQATAADLMLTSPGDARLVNSDTMQDARLFVDGEMRIKNVGSIDLVKSNSSGELRITNEGSIRNMRITGSSEDTIVNRGTIVGSIDTGDGDDRFDGRSGTGVSVFTSDGDDFLRGSAFDDVLVGGRGADLINAGAGDDVVGAIGEENTIGAGNGNDTVRGSGFVSGGNGNDSLTGAGRLEGRDGDDTIRIWRVAEELRTATIDGFALGGAGNDRLVASASNIFGDGLPESNGSVLDGGTGDDIIDAGALAGIIAIGGEGADIFEVDRGSREAVSFRLTTWGFSDIQDYEDGVDRFDFASRDLDDFVVEQVGDDVVFRISEINGNFNPPEMATFTVAIVRDTDIALIDAGDFI